MNSIQISNYRRDIDGLRAVAIWAVILFHAFPKFLPGGFVGVDIFFVISGFLISDLLWRNLFERTFTFKNFYQRRISRLFPALTFVLLSCIVLGALLMHADEFELLGKDILAAVGFVSNFKLLNETNYFSPARELNPLAHLWSLGIEEQFYIFWPLLLWSLRKFKKRIFFVLVFLAGISFFLNLAGSVSSKDQVFYSPLTRIWELVLGGMLSYFPDFLGSTCKNAKRFIHPEDVISLIGLCFITYSFCVFNGKMIFPGFAAVLPTVGAALIIASPQSFFNRSILSNRYLVWMGLISYPLYLWHQVLFSFARILGRLSESNFWFSVGLIITSFALATFTFYFVEKPLRQNKRATKYLVSFFALIGLLGGVIVYNKGFHSRYTIIPNERSERTFRMFGEGYTSCASSFNVNSVICLTPDLPKKARIAVVGDSHASHLIYGLQLSTDPEFNQFTIYAKPQCVAKLFGEQLADCTKMMNQAFEKIEKDDAIEIVIIAGAAFLVAGDQEKFQTATVEHFTKTFDAVLKMNKKIIFVIDGPQFTFSPEDCAPTSLRLRSVLKHIPEVCKTSTTLSYARRPQYKLLVDSLKEKFKRDPRVFFYDGFHYQCPDGCPLFEEERMLYLDTHHLSNYGSQWLVEDLVKQYRRRESHSE